MASRPGEQLDIGALRARVLSMRTQRIQIYVDTNEASHNSDLEKLLPPEIVTFTKLHCGDCWIVLDGKLLFVIERKRWSDLAASITDGRLEQQRFKLRQLPLALNRIFFLVEGTQYKGSSPPYSTLVGALHNIIVRDQMRLMYSSGLHETAYKILDLYQRVVKFGSVWEEELAAYYGPVTPAWNPLFEQKDTTGAAATVSAQDAARPVEPPQTERQYAKAYAGKRKAHKLDNCRTQYKRQLQCIPGISEGKAEAIVEAFPSMPQLAAFFLHPDIGLEDKIVRVAQLRWENIGKLRKIADDDADGGSGAPDDSGDGSKRLGAAIAEKLYVSIMQCENDVMPTGYDTKAVKRTLNRTRRPSSSSSVGKRKRANNNTSRSSSGGSSDDDDTTDSESEPPGKRQRVEGDGEDSSKKSSANAPHVPRLLFARSISKQQQQKPTSPV